MKMKLGLRIVVLSLVLGLLASCTKQELDPIRDSLKNDAYTKVTLKINELDNIAEFQIRAGELLAVLQELKLKQIDAILTEPEATLALEKADGIDHIMLYPSVLRVNDAFLNLSAEQYQKLKQFYEAQVYGKNATLLKKLALDIQYGKYQKAKLLTERSSEFALDLEEVAKGFSLIQNEHTLAAGIKQYSVQLTNDTDHVLVEIGDTYLTVIAKEKSESYVLKKQEPGNLQLLFQEAYNDANVVTLDLSDDEIKVPDFLVRVQQRLFQKGYMMNEVLHGQLFGDYINDFIECVYLLSEPTQPCYYRTNYEQFPDFNSFESYLNSLFTKDMVASILNKRDYIRIGEKLYSLNVSPPSNQFYMGHNFQLIQKTDSTIQFYMIAQYGDWDSRNVTSTKKILVQLDMTKGGWRIAKFALPYAF